MELKIKFETEIKYFDRPSLDLGWIKKISKYIHRNISNLNENYLSMIERRRERRERRKKLLDYPQFYFNGYIKFFTKKKEIIYPFDGENNIANFMGNELCPIVLSNYFFEEDELLSPSENEPTTLSIKLKLDLIEKI